jgi:predicted Zn-dependent protease
LSAYEKKVTDWNKKRDNQEVYDQLNVEKAEIEELLLQINAKRSEVNELASNVNQMVVQLNALAAELNLDIEEYNDVVKSADQEFEQGNYIFGPDSREINIYQFENRAKLVRVLAHELGHALGIDHLNNSEDIMYPYNISENRSITSADLYELSITCPEKKY